MSGYAGDQAEGLRRLLRGAQTRVIALLSAKPRLGQTTVALNLGWSLAAQGNTVWIVDEGLGADSALARLGRSHQLELAQVLKGQATLAQVLIPYTASLSILPAREGLRRSASLNPAERERVALALRGLTPQPDFVLLDLAADRSQINFAAAAAADNIILLLAPEHAALTASYAMIKKLAQDYARADIHLLQAKAKQGGDAQAVYTNMTHTARRYIRTRLETLAPIPWDEFIKRAQRLAKPVTEAYPDAVASRQYQVLAREVMNWPGLAEENGHLEGFLQRLIMSARILQTPAAM